MTGWRLSGRGDGFWGVGFGMLIDVTRERKGDVEVYVVSFSVIVVAFQFVAYTL